ncbi:hypothetical protein ACO0K3_04635 [Undibacterium sp. Rencai35W]|uniref:hypothetical protein n=1 Tax=Undibacterium sp. Rencai35W TaxID=3413046 RepID=UPI003BF034F0
MLKLITILQSLKQQPRQLTDEENLYLEQIGSELRRAENDTARWRILEREGLAQFDGFGFDDDLVAKLVDFRQRAMH